MDQMSSSDHSKLGKVKLKRVSELISHSVQAIGSYGG